MWNEIGRIISVQGISFNLMLNVAKQTGLPESRELWKAEPYSRNLNPPDSAKPSFCEELAMLVQRIRT
jgi:hypothetical protein